ncbi:distal tail protein [Klebsiella phage Soft]|uniref:Distal tail protein n=1 Tax=Klebsiella phage Soft TaxID=2601626 RepID=A0A5C1K8G2_9CAUD|nr:tail assembly protein [Klebsiella phage Soft]QEM42180.1 distal tail protein [Klebsiella phage Soft]
MAGLTDNDALVSSDGLVAHSLTDSTTDASGINPAAGTSSEQFRMVTGLLRAHRIVPRPAAVRLANRILTASVAYLYRGQSSEAGTFIPHYLVGVRHNFTLGNGDVVQPGDAYRISPSAEIEPSTDTDSENRAFRDAYEAFSIGSDVMGENAWTKGRDATVNQVNGSMQYSGLWYTPGAVPVITQFTPGDNGWRSPAYVGKQIGSQWAAQGNTTATGNVLSLMQAAQEAWTSSYPTRVAGLFVPVFYFDAPGSTAYGAANTFGWGGPLDSKGMLDQLVAMRDAADIARLTNTASLKTQAQNIATNALYWFANDRNWTPSNPGIANAWSAAIRKAAVLGYQEGDTVTLPELWFTVPNRLNTDGSFPTPVYEPGLLAVALQAAIAVDKLQRPNNASGSLSTEVARVIEKCVQMFDFTYVTSGVMAGTFSPDPANLKWQGRWHAELLNAIVDLYNWCGQSNNNYTTTQAKARGWITGLLDSAEGLSADPLGGFIYGRSMWPLQPNWKDGMTESVEFSTQIITADSGKEQRLSRRTKPRRTISMRHTLTTADEAAQYQAIIRKRQWRPMLVPQWHMASRTLVAGKVGDAILVLDKEPPATWGVVKALYLVSGDDQQLLNVLRVSGSMVMLRDSLTFPVPRGSDIMPVQYGLLNNDLSSSRAVSTTIEAQVGFTILPQTDTFTVPAVSSYKDLISFIAEQGHRWAAYIRRAAVLNPAVWPTWPPMPSNYTTRMTFELNGDTRMVITRKPNWVSAVTVADAWQYDLIDYYNSAVTPGYAENAGRRTFQAQWTAFTYDEVIDILAVFYALRGAQVACWVPSWSHDLTAAADMPAPNQLRVERNAVIDEEILLDDPSIALMVETFDGSMYCAAATSVTTSVGVSIITLDREFFSALKKTDIMRISLMYRVRQASDSVELTWHARGIAELQTAFITVQE